MACREVNILKKAVNFEDKNIKYVLLDRGNYLIDGKLISVDDYNKKRVKVKDLNNIRKVNNNIVIDYYLNQEDDSRITVSEYEDKLKELNSHRTYKGDWDENGEWNSLEDEYNYRKFKLVWKQITKTVQSISEPILVEEVKTIYDTGNKFIKNAFLNGNSQCDLFIYLRKDAWLHIVKECFDELKMEYFDDCGYLATKNRKIWGNSTHSGIKYVVAFGEYIFDDRFKEPSNLKGTLEDMRNTYKKDRESIRKIIKTKYNKRFGKINENKINFNQLLNDLYELRNSINSIETKKITQRDLIDSKNKVNLLINFIEGECK